MRVCKQQERLRRPLLTLAGISAALFLAFGDMKGVTAAQTAALPVTPASVLTLHVGGLFGATASEEEPAPNLNLAPAAEPRPEQPAIHPLDALSPYLPEPGQWRKVPNLEFDRFRTTDQEADALNIRGTDGSTAVLGQKSGSAYDPEGFLWYFWGGGDDAYGGNEVYRLDLTIPLMSQLTTPSVLDTTVSVCFAPSDGPAAASTFDGFVWSPDTQSFFVFPSDAYCPNGTYNQETIWEFDPLAGTWDPVAGMPGLDGPVFAEYDPVSGLIYIVEAGASATLRDFDPVTGQLGTRADLDTTLSVGNAVLDTNSDELIVFTQEGVYAISLSNPGAINRLADVPGGFDTASGAALDAQRGVVALWDGGQTVRSFDLASNEWTEEAASSGPVAAAGGVFSKWVAIKELGIFAGYNNPAEGLWLYRLPTTLNVPPPPNRAPVAFLGNTVITAHTGSAVNLDGSGSFDPDDDVLTYVWSTVSSPAGNAPTLTTPNQPTTSFTPAVNGGYVLRLTVSDGALSDTVTVNVTAGNTAPVADAGADKAVQIGQTATLDASGSTDADGDTLSYSWSFTTVPSGSTAALSGAQTVSPSFVADKEGVYRLSLAASDGIASTLDTMDVTATTAPVNRAPVADAGADQSLIEGQTATLNGLQSSDPDGNSLFYTWTLTSQPAGSAASLSNTTAAQPTLALDVAGTYVASLTVDDGVLTSAADAVSIVAGIDTGTAGGNDPALLAYWKLDENTGSTAGDSAQGANGTIFGATWTSGVTGSALSFAGSDYVVIDNTPELNITGAAITMAAWIKPISGGEVGNGSRIISKRTDAGDCDTYSMFTLDNKFRFRLDCSDLISSSSFSTDGWIHVAMVYNGTDKRIYLNGVLDQSVQTKTDTIDASTRAVHLGMRENEARFFLGLMDDAQVYNRALSATEITSLFDAAGMPASQLATITAGSGGGTTPPPPASTVAVALTASPLVVAAGDSSTLSWSSTDATSCTASGGWSGTTAVNGSQTVSPSVTTTYSLSCTGSSGSAQSGATVIVGSSTNIVDSLQPGHWFAAPNSRLDSVDPCPGGGCSYSGNTGIASVMIAWSGGAYDTQRDRLIVWGGGHWDYAGNELYAFDVNTLQWQRLTSPSTSVTASTSYYPDGLPSSRHTYDYLEYLPSVDRFCTVGGASIYGPGGSPNLLDCYSFQNARWENFGSLPSGLVGAASISGTDSQGNLWSHGTTTNGDRLAKYEPQSNTWTAYTPDGYMDIRYVATIDTVQNKMYAIGDGEFVVWDLNNPNSPRQLVSTSGATEIQNAGYAGIAYHPPSGKIVAWSGGSSIYLFDPNTRVWTKETPAATNSVTPTAANSQGTYGRFRYVPSKDVFITVNQVDENVFFYKLKSSTAPAPGPTPAPTVTLSASPSSIASGQTSVLTWSSANAASCSSGGDWSGSSATSGSQSVTPTQTTNYTLTCTGTGGATLQSVTVTVSAAPAPGTLPVGTLVHDGPATPEQMSLLLPVTGTLSQTATASVRYRQVGAQAWTTGHPLHRVRPEFSQSPAQGSVQDVFAWPIIDLAPGSAYEVEVTIVSGSTTDTRTATFTTRALPVPAGAPNKVIPAGSSQAEIQTVFDNLNPGDVLEFENGTYNVNSLQLNRSGTQNNPIYIRGRSRAGATLASNGRVFQLLETSYVVIENMTLLGSGVDSGTNSSSKAIEFFDGTPNQTQITVRNVTINGVDMGIIAHKEIYQFLAYDNTLLGNNQWADSFINTNATWNDDGIRIPGFGNAAFNNTLVGFGDSLSFAAHAGSDTLTQSIGVHFYRNDVRNSGDDFTEIDHGHRNLTVYDNRSHNSMTFVSLDPLYGGPALVARNIAINVGRSPFKWNSTNTGQFIYNNTVVRTTGRDWVDGNFAAEAGWYQANNGDQRAYGYRNNILVYRGDGNQTIRLDNSGHDIVDFTHNSWYPNLVYQWPQGRFNDLAHANNSLSNTTPLFSGATRRHENDNITVANPWTTTVTLGVDYRTEVTGTYIPLLSAGTAPKNSGAVIPNITDNFSGFAPDRGAVIEGRALPLFGQR